VAARRKRATRQRRLTPNDGIAQPPKYILSPGRRCKLFFETTMSAAYTPLPTTANGHGYPSNQSNAKALLARLTPAAPPTRIRRLLAFLAVLALSSTLVVYLVFSPSFSFAGGSSASPGSNYDYSTNNGYDGGTYGSNEGGNGGGGGGVGPDGPASPFFRDAHPALHARLFLARAQAEIRERGLDTCGGQLGSKMVDTYMKNKVEYCKPSGASASSLPLSSTHS
jgi:hypothetical protein